MLNPATAQTALAIDPDDQTARVWNEVTTDPRNIGVAKFRIPRYAIRLVREETMNYFAATKRIESARNISELLRPIFEATDRELFLCVTLDTKYQPIGINVVSVGTLNQSLVHPRETLKLAILQNAAAIILAHNHPSGDTEPSRDDQVITDRMMSAAQVLGIRLLDHVILGDGTDAYFSFADSGRLRAA